MDRLRDIRRSAIFAFLRQEGTSKEVTRWQRLDSMEHFNSDDGLHLRERIEKEICRP